MKATAWMTAFFGRLESKDIHVSEEPVAGLAEAARPM